MDTLNDNGEMQEANKAVARRLLEQVLGKGHMQLLQELIAVGHVSHLAIGDHYGPEGVRIAIAAYRAALSDLVVTLDDMLADGDRVARRFTISGTFRGSLNDDAPVDERFVVLHGIAIDRFEDGRVAESWVSIDGPSRISPDVVS
jgi:predicted ester cyclase